MCNNSVIDSYVIILVEIKLVYRGLKEIQGTMVTNASICLSIIELICYV